MPEDLVDTVIAADALRRQTMGWPKARYQRGQRTWIEPFFNLFGTLFGLTSRMIPGVYRRPLHRWLCGKMGGHAPEENPRLPTVTAQTVQLTRELRAKTGRWPAIIIFSSHPVTEGELHWLRFELLRQGLEVADAVMQAEGRAAHPKCFLAIDPYALDTVSAAVGGFYAAWMHRIYLAWDRQPSTQSWIQRNFLLRQTGYEHIAWRLLRDLREGIPVLMVLAGGLPYNARLLYAAREFVQRLKLARWPMSKRAAEKRLMEILTHPSEGIWPAEGGRIPDVTRRDIQRFLSDLGIPETDIDARLSILAEEFLRPVPSRERLFRILLARIVARGQPLLLLGVNHADYAPHVHLSPPLTVVPGSAIDAAELARSVSRFFQF